MRSAFRFAILLGVFVVGCGGGGPNLKPGPMPDEGTYSGVYFSPQYGEMHLVQNGSAVVGKYKKDERSGEIQGEADGDLLRFDWVEYKAMVSNRPQETRGRGYFRYMIDASNGDHVLKGRWGLGDEETTGGEWNAYKSRSREPDLESMGGEQTAGGDDLGDDVMEPTAQDESVGDDEADDAAEDDIF